MFKKCLTYLNLRRLARLCLFLLTACIGLEFSSCAASDAREKYTNYMLKAYHSMHTGDWAYYHLTENVSAMMQVLATTKDGVFIIRHGYFGGAPALKGFSVEFKFKDIERNLKAGKGIDGVVAMSDPAISRERVKIEDRYFDCTVYTFRTVTNDVIAIYTNDSVSLDKIVMVKRNGTVIRSLITYGRAGQPIATRPAPPGAP